MVQIFPQGTVNIAALNADDLYIQIVNPPSFIVGTPTDVFGTVGTASWGPINTPVHMGSGTDAQAAFGPISAASLVDPYDLPTDLALAFGQSSNQAAIEGWAVRIGDGTQAAAIVTINGSASGDAATATIGGTVTAGDTLTLICTSAGVTGSPVHVAYTTVMSDTTATIAAALSARINVNVNLVAAGIVAQVSGSIISIYAPSTLSSTWTDSLSGGATETIAIGTGGTEVAGAQATANYTGSLGNQITFTFSTGTVTNTTTVVVQGFTGAAEVYPNLPNVPFWTTLQAAMAGGFGTQRAPSQWARLTNPNNAVTPPTAGTTVTLAGGTDGRTNVTTANILGSDTANPRTGLYALRSLTPPVSIVWAVGMLDQAFVSPLLQFGLSEGASVLFSFPQGTSTATAVSDVTTIGQRNPALQYMKDYCYFYDQVNGQTRAVPPYAFFAGTVCALTPEQSPGNKPVALVSGTDRFNPLTGIQPYTESEVGQLETSGITFITNPIPAGSVFGIRHGQTSSLDPATAPFEWWRMTSYLARSFGANLGQYVGQLQSQQPNDPLRNAVKLSLNNFLNLLEGLGQIDGFQVNCNFSSAPSAQPGLGMNTPQSVAQHYLFVLVQVTYLSSVRFFVLSLQGGTTVVTVGNTLQQSQQAA